MGGTSFDLCLVRGGQPEIKTDWNWRYRYYIGLPDGRRAERRRRRRVDRPGAPGRAARRPRVRPAPRPGRSATAGAATGRPSPTPTRCSATCPLDGFAGGRMTLDVDAARDARSQRDVAEPLGLDVIEAAWGIERIVNANMANATRRVLAGARRRPPRARADRLRRQRRGARVGDRRRARHRPHPRARRRRRRSPRSACSSPTTSSTSCARTSCRCRRSTSAALRDADARAAATRPRKELEPDRPRRDASVDVSCSCRCATRARTST